MILHFEIDTALFHECQFHFIFFFIFRRKDVDSKSLSESYKSNSPKEKLVLSFCENFRRQFVHLYRDRKPLFLNPLNECGIEV